MGVRHIELAKQGQVAPCFLKYGDGPRFSGDAQIPQTWVEGENVRIIAHLINRKKFHGPEVEHPQGMVFLPSNESQSICFVERDTVGVLNSRKLVPADDLHCRRIDRAELIDFVNCHEDVA